MATPTDPHFAKARRMSEFELQKWLGYNEGSPMHAAAATELDRRKFWKSFFTHGIASWFALGVSILSLAVSAYVAFFKHGG